MVIQEQEIVVQIAPQEVKMKVSDYIAEFLHERGVRCVFEMSGGMITHMLDSLCQQNEVAVVSTHHEQAAAFAADAFGRMTGIPGIAMATSGPGATNLLTGIGSCHFDSAPAVFITGQVNRHELKGTRAIRQLGFQETDIVSMATPITKAAWMVESPEDIPAALEKAFEIATSGRPGPVLLDVPMDVQRAGIIVPRKNAASSLADNNNPGSTHPTVTTTAQQDASDEPAIDEVFLSQMFAQMRQAKRPLILVGGGVRAGDALELARDFINRVGVPVVFSLMAVDVVPFDEPLRAGWIGSYGNRWSNLAIGRSDFMLVLGSRLDIRQTGSDTESFKGDRRIFHVDCEAGEMNNRVTGCDVMTAELRPFFTAALAAAATQEFPERTAWLNEIADLRDLYPDTAELAGTDGINPNTFMHQLSAASRDAAAYVVDVGQHQMWAAQSLEIGTDQRFLTSGGMGSMGFALPAAIGAAFAAAPRPVVVVAGDGGFQSNIQELQTVVRNRLPIKMVIINNECHGMVRQFQESYFDSRYQSTLWGYTAPDFARVADAYGIDGRTVEQEADVEAALSWLWQDPAKPALLQVMISTYANAYPKIAFGRPMT
jgi:acetolactate synthase-1/2/3 large subunit